MTHAPTAMAPAELDTSDAVFDEKFKPLTPEDADRWRAQNPTASPWWVVVYQLLVGCVVVVVAGLVGGAAVAMSAAYGALAVVLPAALLVRGLRRQQLLKAPGAALVGFVVWESVKVVVTVLMLFAAPRLVPGLSWLALVAGFVVVMKVYWVAAWLQSKRKHPA